MPRSCVASTTSERASRTGGPRPVGPGAARVRPRVQRLPRDPGTGGGDAHTTVSISWGPGWPTTPCPSGSPASSTRRWWLPVEHLPHVPAVLEAFADRRLDLPRPPASHRHQGDGRGETVQGRPLAPDGVPLVMSDAAWDDYEVAGLAVLRVGRRAQRAVWRRRTRPRTGPRSGTAGTATDDADHATRSPPTASANRRPTPPGSSASTRSSSSRRAPRRPQPLPVPRRPSRRRFPTRSASTTSTHDQTPGANQARSPTCARDPDAPGDLNPKDRRTVGGRVRRR